MGAKNHGVIMPDANKEYTINQLVGAAFGAAGQRCMALSTAVLVGDAASWLPEVAEKATKLKISAGHEPGTDLPPVISADAKVTDIRTGLNTRPNGSEGPIRL
jgi:malonate-semialdehyde dehydrogenase (acetylating)/methylmalonate-semialdehyde dehydrogenase